MHAPTTILGRPDTVVTGSGGWEAGSAKTRPRGVFRPEGGTYWRPLQLDVGGCRLSAVVLVIGCSPYKKGFNIVVLVIFVRCKIIYSIDIISLIHLFPPVNGISKYLMIKLIPLRLFLNCRPRFLTTASGL